MRVPNTFIYLDILGLQLPPWAWDIPTISAGKAGKLSDLSMAVEVFDNL